MTMQTGDRAAGLVRRTYVAGKVREVAADTFEYVLSDATPDRMGDVIDPAGWQLANFKKNPIALFGHDTGFIVGNWSKVRVVDGELRGELKLLPPTSDRMREVDAAVQAGVLRAVSVGFRPIKAEPLDEDEPFDGTRFLKQELVEASLVAVGANPNALQIAKSLNLSPQTVSLIFGVPAKEDQSAARGAQTGVTAETNANRKPTNMNTLSAKVEAAQQRMTTATDALESFVGKLGDIVAGDDTKTMDRLADEVSAAKASLASLQKAEQLLGVTSEIVVRGTGSASPIVRPFAQPKEKEPKPGDYFLRAATVLVLARITQRPTDAILRERYHDDERTRAFFEQVTKSATVPATTTLAGWAAELAAGVGQLDMLEQLAAQSVYPALSARGPKFTLGRNGSVSIPSRAPTPTIGGSFIAQGAPIPVRQAGFAALVLGLKKMGVITTATREIVQHSTPAIEGILRQAMQEDTAVAIDNVLLSTTAATAVAPAGIRAGVAGLTPTTGGGFNALVGDLKQLVAVLVSANSLRSPVFIMNPAQTLSIALTQNAGGDFPFQSQIEGGNLLGYGVIQSTTQPAGTVTLLEAADFVSATGDTPQFDVSDQAVVHMDDTTPLPIGSSGAPNTIAAPTRSLWQTDSIGIRMLLDINWSMRRTGLVAWVAGVTW
jgi:HK97 family phage prohead protease/HK97 family phage major capsid protein